MSRDLLEKLDKEITEQTRNGREDVYIDVDDLNELGYGIDPNKTGKVYVDVNYLRIVMKRYKFKDNLRVTTKEQTFKELENEIKKIERGKERDDD